MGVKCCFKQMKAAFTSERKEKKMKKKLFVIGLLVLTMMFSACSKSDSKSSSGSGESNSTGSTIKSADDLKGKVIGVQLGTTGDIYAEDVEDAKIEKYNKGADAIQALKQGKIDAVIIDREPAKEFIKKNDDLQILDVPFVEEEYSVAYKIGNDDLGKKLDDAIAALKNEGKLDEIVSHWIGESADQVSYVPDSSVTRTGKLVMATNAAFPPYELKEGDEVVGIDADMMRAVCDKLGLELEIEDMEFDSIIAAVASGKVDVGVAGISVTDERKKNVNFTVGYAKSTQVIIVRK